MMKTTTLAVAAAFLMLSVGVAAQETDRPDARPDGRPDCTESDHPSCKADDPAKQARRAAHHAQQAFEHIQDRVFRLEMMEYRASQALAETDDAEEQAELEAKIARIQAAQDELLAKAAAMHDRLEGIKDRWDEARDHAEGREKVVICHVGDDVPVTIRVGAKAAESHLEHHEGDAEGACEGDDGPPRDRDDTENEADDDDDESDDQTDSDEA